MRKTARSVSKLVLFRPDMLDQIETYMEIRNTNFSESVRRIISAYFANQTVANVSVQDSEPIDQPPEVTPKPDKPVNGDFNWDGLDIE
jgi:hypothetical protein